MFFVLFCVFMYWKSWCMWTKYVWLWMSCTEREGGLEGNHTPWFVKEEGMVGGGNQGGATNPLAAAPPSSTGGGRLAEGWVALIGPPLLRCWLFTHAPTFPLSLGFPFLSLPPRLACSHILCTIPEFSTVIGRYRWDDDCLKFTH